MKRIGIFAVFAMVVNVALGKTINLGIPSCSSSPYVIIDVKQLAASSNEIFVDVYRTTKNVEGLYYTGKVSGKGTVTLSQVPIGKYRVFANNGDQTGQMYVLVSKFQKPTECEVIATPRALLFVGAKTVAMRVLHGTVKGPTGVAIEGAKVALYREGGQNIVSATQTDNEGKFNLPRPGDGWYWARFEPTGKFYELCRVSIHVRITEKGWPGLRLSLPILDNAAPGYCERASKIENVSDPKN